MAGYFSNHSQSRFLAISNNGGHGGNSTGTSAATATSTTTVTTPSQNAARPPKAPSSKHFSTSVSNSSGDEKPSSKDKLGVNAGLSGSGNGTAGSPKPTVHPLRHTYVQKLLFHFERFYWRTFYATLIDGYSGSDNIGRQVTKSRIMKRESRRYPSSVPYALKTIHYLRFLAHCRYAI